jgi:hypothetical protein
MTDRKTLIALFAVAAFALGGPIALAQPAPAQQTPAAASGYSSGSSRCGAGSRTD